MRAMDATFTSGGRNPGLAEACDSIKGDGNDLQIAALGKNANLSACMAGEKKGAATLSFALMPCMGLVAAKVGNLPEKDGDGVWTRPADSLQDAGLRTKRRDDGPNFRFDADGADLGVEFERDPSGDGENAASEPRPCQHCDIIFHYGAKAPKLGKSNLHGEGGPAGINLCASGAPAEIDGVYRRERRRAARARAVT